MRPRGRTCVGCRRRAARGELVRLVRGPEGARVDPRGTAPGRGAYLCPDLGCLRAARRRLAGALRVGRVDDAVIERDFARALAERGRPEP